MPLCATTTPSQTPIANTQRWLGPLTALFLLAGCLPAPEQESFTVPDAGGTHLLVGPVEVRDHLGACWPADAIPRSPRITLPLSTSIVDSDAGPWLLRGVENDSLARDLAQRPLNAGTQSRLIAAQVRWSGDSVTIEPDTPLAPGEDVLLVLGAWARGTEGEPLGEASITPMRVSAEADAGARIIDTWPASGAHGVSPQMREMALRFDGNVRGPLDAFSLKTENTTVPVEAAFVPCLQLGWSEGSCVRLIVAALTPMAEYRLAVGAELVSDTGAPVGPWEAVFHTGSASDAGPPSWLDTQCPDDAVDMPWGCIEADDGRVSVSVHPHDAARLTLRLGNLARRTVNHWGPTTLSLDGLSEGTLYSGSLRAEGHSGEQVEVTFEATTLQGLAMVSITEVRANPEGPEPQQEYVELLNYGQDPVDLGGMRLADRADREGDLLPPARPLGAGERILVVADSFDAALEAPNPLPAGTRLLRVGTSLGSGGLANAGESLYLRDREGRILSATPALPPAAEGRCLERVGEDPRHADPRLFLTSEDRPCTPGRP